MAFGAYAPLPLRLGGSPTEGWTAEQHARLCADLVALKRTMPIAVVTYTPDGLGNVTLHGYYGRNGVGSAHAPSIAINGTGDCTLTWPARWEDDYARSGAWNIVNGSVGLGSTNGGTSSVQFTPNTVRVRTFDNAGVAAYKKVTLVVYGHTDEDSPLGNVADIGDYGGDTAKRDSETEGARPYAFLWFRELQAMRGSAYTTKTGTLVDAENLAIARSQAAITRGAEKLAANATPATSDERLEYWQEVLRPPLRKGDKRWQIRQACAAHYRSAQAPTDAKVDEAIAALLGDCYVKSWRQTGVDLATPPTVTYWPGINPGPTAYDLGGGTWLSERAHLVVEVQWIKSLSLKDFLYLVNAQLFTLLNRMLPAHATFNWALAPLSTGFLADISQADFTGAIP